MKIYAKQVPPEHQESPLFNGCYDWPENVFVFGNTFYNQHAERLENIGRDLENIADTFDDIQRGYLPNENLHAVLWYHLPRDDGRGYSRAERLELVKLANDFCKSNYDKETLCRVLELITGTEYAAATIRGCCQGDWQNIIYPAEYGRDWLETFEAEYFNTGSEWCVKENDDDPGYYQYCTGWNNELIRAEIADAAGCDPGDVILYAFTGWSKTAEYEEASA